MRVGVVREVKSAERRVGLTPAGARELVADGHAVLVEADAGVGSGFLDEAYLDAGALVVDRDEVWGTSELLVKVKEPVETEYGSLREDLVLFTYLHLAAERPLTAALLEAGTCALAYETIEDEAGQLPLLAPMSEIAGRLAAQAGALYLQAPQGGNGILIGGAPGVAPARVVVLGGGIAGNNAARVAVGMGAEVTILELSQARIRTLEAQFEGRARVLVSDMSTLHEQLETADVLIGAVLVPGARAPKLVRRKALSRMPLGSVMVDVAIDQGGCAETSRPTTHEEPVYVDEGVIHYCVTNMPGAVPATSTRALTSATLPYLRRLAGLGVDTATANDPGLARAINVRKGEIVYSPVREAYETAEPTGASGALSGGDST